MIKHLISQWIFWALLIGALAAIGYLVFYDRRNRRGHKRKIERRDALLLRILLQAEGFGTNDITNNVNCSGRNFS